MTVSRETIGSKMSASPLLETLRIVEALSLAPASVDALAAHISASTVTVKRYIAEARLLGADIRSTRCGKLWLYELRNPEHVMAKTLRWIELEESRNLLGPVVAGATPPGSGDGARDDAGPRRGGAS
jgi:hypothetical protein